MIRATWRSLMARKVRLAMSTFAISLVATLFPATQASRMTPVDAIRYE